MNHGPPWDRGMSKIELLVLKDVWSRKGCKRRGNTCGIRRVTCMPGEGGCGPVTVVRGGPGKDSLLSQK